MAEPAAAINVPAGPSLRGLSAGPDSNMYFTEPAYNNVGRVPIGATSAGITEYPVPTAGRRLDRPHRRPRR